MAVECLTPLDEATENPLLVTSMVATELPALMVTTTVGIVTESRFVIVLVTLMWPISVNVAVGPGKIIVRVTATVAVDVVNLVVTRVLRLVSQASGHTQDSCRDAAQSSRGDGDGDWTYVPPLVSVLVSGHTVVVV